MFKIIPYFFFSFFSALSPSFSFLLLRPQDFTAFHADQYFSGVNMTIGASFGEERFVSVGFGRLEGGVLFGVLGTPSFFLFLLCGLF